MENDKTGNWMDGKYMGSVKVGPKGQIIIPKEAREIFGIEPGDMLLLLADKAQGIAILPFNDSRFVFEKMFPGMNRPEPE